MERRMKTRIRVQEKYKNCISYFMIIITAVISYVGIYGLLPLQVTYDKWAREGYAELDVLQGYAGWMIFRNSPWTFPLGIATHSGYPWGESVAHTVSNPLLCLLCKVFREILPETFQFFGWEVLGCMILNGVFAYLIIRLFSDNRAVCFLGSVFFIISPVLLERAFRNSSLANHYVILAGFLLYFSGRKKPGRNEHTFHISKWYLLLSGLAVMIHMYFVPVVYGILFAHLAEDCVKSKSRRVWLKNLAFLVCNFFVTIVTAYIIGLFGQSVSGGSGYGFFSMNLNALFNPSSKDFINENTIMSWSSILPVLPQLYGNYDGFNYLGVGIIFMLLLGIVSCGVKWYTGRRKGQPGQKIFREHWGLVFVCVCITIFAISHWISFNDIQLAVLPLPENLVVLLSSFRSGGRIFYLVYYLLYITAVYMMIRSIKNKWQPWVLGILLLVQVIDLTPAFVHKREFFRGYEEQDASSVTDWVWMKSNFWDTLGEDYTYLHLVGEDSYVIYYLGIYAGTQDLITNAFVGNRSDEEAVAAYQQAMLEELIAGEGKKDTVYLIPNETFQGSGGYIKDERLMILHVDDHFVAFIPREGMPKYPEDAQTYEKYQWDDRAEVLRYGIQQ